MDQKLSGVLSLRWRRMRDLINPLFGDQKMDVCKALQIIPLPSDFKLNCSKLGMQLDMIKSNLRPS